MINKTDVKNEGCQAEKLNQALLPSRLRTASTVPWKSFALKHLSLPSEWPCQVRGMMRKCSEMRSMSAVGRSLHSTYKMFSNSENWTKTWKLWVQSITTPNEKPCWECKASLNSSRSNKQSFFSCSIPNSCSYSTMTTSLSSLQPEWVVQDDKERQVF